MIDTKVEGAVLVDPVLSPASSCTSSSEVVPVAAAPNHYANNIVPIEKLKSLKRKASIQEDIMPNERRPSESDLLVHQQTAQLGGLAPEYFPLVAPEKPRITNFYHNSDILKIDSSRVSLSAVVFYPPSFDASSLPSPAETMDTAEIVVIDETLPISNASAFD